MRTTTIVLTGPESSGKTTLTTQLASHFNAEWIPEFARAYIDNLDRPYLENDLLKIAEGQLRQENEMVNKTGGLVFLDTSLEVIKIWSDYKYGQCHPWILEQLNIKKHDLYLLCHPDIPWQSDPQRESPNDRNKIFKLYHQELTQQNTNFVEVSGLNEQRLQIAIHHVQSLIHPQAHAYHA